MYSSDDSTFTICKEGNIEQVLRKIEQLLRNDQTPFLFCLNYGLEGACTGGHLDIVKLLISKGANCWNFALPCACESGNVDIVELLISKGAYNWNGGLYSACYAGHFGMIELMISKGANDWNNGLVGACQS